MPLYTVIGRDRPEAFELRAATRAAHLDWLAASPVPVKLGGPFTDAQGRSVGSLLVVEAHDLDAARRWAADDPYAKAGLFAQVAVEPWKLVIGGFGQGA